MQNSQENRERFETQLPRDTNCPNFSYRNIKDNVSKSYSKPTITLDIVVGEVPNLPSDSGGAFAEQLSTYFRVLL